LVLVEAMVADIGGDRIRDEIAHRSPGGRPFTDLRGRQAHARTVEEDRLRRRRRKVTGEKPGVDFVVAEPRRDDDRLGEREDAPGLVPGRELGEGLGREDQRQAFGGVGRPQRRQRFDRVRRPAAIELDAADLEPVLCGGWAAGMNSTRRRSNVSRAASATARWA
jgi:hypothetical protein